MGMMKCRDDLPECGKRALDSDYDLSALQNRCHFWSTTFCTKCTKEFFANYKYILIIISLDNMNREAE